MSDISGATIVKGLILGWSVAWPPGPINAEMIRRALKSARKGGGFWAAWQLGLGACTGDFFWALGVAAGAGALLARRGCIWSLASSAFCLLLFLAFSFARGAWQRMSGQLATAESPAPPRRSVQSRGYFLGLILALTSPWNIGFWFAVVGGQGATEDQTGFLSSVMLAVAVVSGAIAWTVVLCIALKMGARIFAQPAWQIATQALSALVMLFFAARLLWLWK